MVPLPGGKSVAAAVAERQSEIIDKLRALDDRKLGQPSRLPDWNRLTIACHLRYGALASARMTRQALKGTATAFYPEGRDDQRPATLHPAEGEPPSTVVSSLAEASHRLDQLWADVDDHRWDTAIEEPPDKRDLGPITLWTLALLRLTEVEVHGYDLDIGLSPWSDTFVSAALPTRLEWLRTRRSNHRIVDGSIAGSWAIVSTDGPTYLVQAKGLHVQVEETESQAGADVSIVGTASQLLAFILGRAPLRSLDVRGDADLAASFLSAFAAP